MLFVLLSAFTFRLSRFLILDTLISGTRAKVHIRLVAKGKWWSTKLYELVNCPYCISIWISGITVIVIDTATNYSIPLPVVFWLAVSTGSLLFWSLIED